MDKAFDLKKILAWSKENIVTVIFIGFTLLGFILSKGVSVEFFLNDLISRVFRNLFLVLSLVIPVVAGLGLNFGIVIGAMSGQIAIAIVRYFELGGIGGMLLCFAITVPIAILFGFLTGSLYNKTRGQEMIASLIVSYFANGIYQFLLLFAVGVIIPVSATHPMIMPDGIGVRMTVDLQPFEQGGLKYALDNILKIPFMHTVMILTALILLWISYKQFVKKDPIAKTKASRLAYWIEAVLCVGIIIFSIYAIVTNSSLMSVSKIPVVTALLIVALCIFTEFILKTKLGQDFRSVGQDQHISEISGINVDKRRILAVIISTVLAGWGQLIYLQNMGTLNTYGAHTQIGMFSVAALLVGGATTSKAKVSHAIIGTVLFNAMFIMSPAIGEAVFGQALLGEYFRTFMVYGVIGVALSLYAWKALKKFKVNV